MQRKDKQIQTSQTSERRKLYHLQKLIKYKSFLICRCLYFVRQKSFGFNVFISLRNQKMVNSMRNNGNLRSLNTPQNTKLPQYIQTFLGSISTSWVYFLGTFYRVLIISTYKYSRFTDIIYNFAPNAKKLHHEKGRYK